MHLSWFPLMPYRFFPFDGAPLSDTQSRTRSIHRFIWALLLFWSIGLLASSVYRAATFPFTTVSLDTNWLMEPSLNFYRITRHYTWLAPMTRKPISSNDNEYLYAFESEVAELPRDRHISLAFYPDTRTVLLRVQHAPGSSALP